MVPTKVTGKLKEAQMGLVTLLELQTVIQKEKQRQKVTETVALMAHHWVPCLENHWAPCLERRTVRKKVLRSVRRLVPWTERRLVCSKQQKFPT